MTVLAGPKVKNVLRWPTICPLSKNPSYTPAALVLMSTFKYIYIYMKKELLYWKLRITERSNFWTLVNDCEINIRDEVKVEPLLRLKK